MVNEVEEHAVDDKENIHDHKQVVGVPEGIEPCYPIKRLRELHEAPPEPPCRQGKGDRHQDHHQDPSDALGTLQKIEVGWSPCPEIIDHVFVVDYVGCMYEPREITGKVVSYVKDDANHDRHRNRLHRNFYSRMSVLFRH